MRPLITDAPRASSRARRGGTGWTLGPNGLPQPTRNNDDGSLLMALLFTLMISALTLAIMASVMAGMKKADNSRAFALAQQAADIAIADALMHANMRRLTTSPYTNSGQVFPSGTTGGTGIGRPIDWTWTATQTSPADWTIDVEARGKSIDRHFRTTLTRTPVIQGTWSDTNDDTIKDNIRYTAKNNRPFGSGFYGRDIVEFTSSNGRNAIVDGYNGGRGILGTSSVVTANDGGFDVANLWGWKPTDTLTLRCTGTDCTTSKARKFEQDFQRETVSPCTGPHQSENWLASSAVPLKNGDCYASLTFDVDYYFAPDTPNQQAWISSRGDVIVNPGVNVGTNRTTTYTKATSWVIEISGGKFHLNNGAMFSGAIYNPGNNCVADGAGATQATTWMGAAVCGSLRTTGNIRLRYDGGMSTVERPGDTTTGPGVWSLRDFQIVD